MPVAHRQPAQLAVRQPCPDDGPFIHRLIGQCPPLDLNSSYCYTLLCDHFAPTCALAGDPDRPAAFCSAYRLPDRPDTLFVWQVAVHPQARGQGLARRLIMDILARQAASGVCHLQATVSPSNRASRALFDGIARQLDADLTIGTGYPESALSLDQSHEAEPLIHIGPFQLERPHQEK